MEQKYEKERILERVRYSSETMKEILSKYYKEDETERIMTNSIEEVEKLIPVLPYLGEEENIFLGDFFDSLLHLGLYKVLNKEGSTVRDVGKLVYEFKELQMTRMSKFEKFITSRIIFTSYVKKRNQKILSAMNEKNYHNNWNMEFIEGDKKEFNWGMNIHQCAIHKFYLENGGEELAPYICLQDFAIYHPFKRIGFRRSQVLAGGADYCDFRLKKGVSTPKGWPPEDTAEWR